LQSCLPGPHDQVADPLQVACQIAVNHISDPAEVGITGKIEDSMTATAFFIVSPAEICFPAFCSHFGIKKIIARIIIKPEIMAQETLPEACLVLRAS